MEHQQIREPDSSLHRRRARLGPRTRALLRNICTPALNADRLKQTGKNPKDPLSPCRRQRNRFICDQGSPAKEYPGSPARGMKRKADRPTVSPWLSLATAGAICALLFALGIARSFFQFANLPRDAISRAGDWKPCPLTDGGHHLPRRRIVRPAHRQTLVQRQNRFRARGSRFRYPDGFPACRRPPRLS